MAGKFELTTTDSGKFMFNLKAGNGQVILTSQAYENKAGAENGIASVRTNAADDARFERRKAVNGDPYFVLNAANGQTIGRSEMYSSEVAMENGIASVRNNASDATVSDITT
ncbi:MAG TPA: YegP family protein [Blastocatellia bacterium]|nr:YegP family protein [Blastocatellia bacterium]